MFYNKKINIVIKYFKLNSEYIYKPLKNYAKFF